MALPGDIDGLSNGELRALVVRPNRTPLRSKGVDGRDKPGDKHGHDSGDGAKMCPRGQGMPGRVYQIDAGWMGGAASTGYRERPFGLLARDHVGPDVHWCGEPAAGFNVFLKM